jgi:histidyl-tRNA synthetase
MLPTERKTPTTLLVTVLSEEQRPACNEAARAFRAAGVNTEVFFTAPKLGKQIDYAAGKGIPFVAFVGEGGGIEIKDLASKEQVQISSVEAWAAGMRGK